MKSWPLLLSFIATAIVTPVRAQTGAASDLLDSVPLVSFPEPWTSPYRLDPEYPHQLVNDEGAHLFILNKTAWAFFGARDPQGFLERAREQGITVIRVALEGRPYFDHLGIDLWPWGGTRENPEWTSFDARYWDRVEDRVRLAGEAGIGLDIVLYFTLHPGEADSTVQRAYWDYAMERLGKYANVLTWEIANEYTANEAFQDVVGTYLYENDPYARPVITSAGTTDDAVWPDRTWMGMAIVHTCTGSTPRYDLQSWYQSVGRNVRSHGKPSFNNESGREQRHKNDDPVHRRKQGWIWNMTGGFWTWHSWEGCEGIDDPDYRGPGAQYLRPMSDFFRSIPFWRLQPNFTAFVVDDPLLIQTTLSDPDRDRVISYLCLAQTGADVSRSFGVFRLPGGEYDVSFIDPATLTKRSTERVTAEGVGTLGEIQIPGFEDDVLVVIEKRRAGENTRFEDAQ